MNANIFNLQRFAKVTTKNLTTKADDYTNTKSNIVINALAGNDTVSNTANKVTISGGDGNDIITSIGYTIDEDTNWESDFNLFGTNDSISGGAGNDTIKNVFNNSKTDGGKGDDYIIVGETVRAIDPGAEYYDTYYHYVGDKSIVKGGDGNDTLEVYGTNSTIEGGSGNDSIAVYGYDSTITGGTGDDIISLNGSPLINVYGGYLMSADSLSQKDSSVSEVIKYASGDGKDTVVGFTSNDTLKITSGTFSTVKSGNDIIIKVGKGSVNLKNAVGQTINILSEKGTLTTITTCNDITNATDGKTVEGTKAEDHISNTGKNVTINGGTGDDSIKSGRQYILAGMNESDENYGDTAYTYKKTGGDAGTIIAGSGNDTIENSQNQTLVDGGKGNDYIVDSYVEISFEERILENDLETDIEKWTDSDFDKVQGWTERSNENTVKGGAGNDTIAIYGAYSTVEGGKGNDLISLKNTSKNNVVKYASGDGNDTIVGLSGNDTLHITSGTYSTVSSGKNLILKIGKGSVLLKDALADGYTKIHLKDSLGYDVILNDWTIRNGSVENNKFGDVTLAGSQKADTIGNSAENVLITGRGGNDSISNRGDNVSIDGGKGNDYIGNIYQSFDEDGYTVYKGGKNLTIAGGAGNDTIENCGDNVTITGGTGNDSISNSNGGNNVVIDGGKGNDDIYNVGANVSISGGAGNDSIESYGDNATITGGKGNDLIAIAREYYDNGASSIIQYASGDGDDTVTGFSSNDILHITSGDYTAEVSGTDVIFTVGKGTITLKDVAEEKISVLTTKTYNSSTSDLFAENNFMTTDNLSAIVENNSVGEFEFNSPEKLTQENLITFAEK